MTDMIRRSRCGRPSVQRQRGNNWTPAKRAVFLDHLAATCNVTRSCEAAGMRANGAYGLRRVDPGFAEQWRAALLTGYDRLEEALIQHAMRGLSDVEHGEVPETPFDPAVAMALIKMHENRKQGLKKAGGPAVRRATEEETDAAILKQLAAISKRADADKA